MAGFGLAEEHQNCLLTAAPSKVVAGGGSISPISASVDLANAGSELVHLR